MKRQLTLTFLLLLFPVLPLAAQNTSSVFSPDVTKGKHAVEYRAAFDPDTDAFTHRLHYQYGFTESWRMRLIFTQFDRANQDLEFRYVRWEGLWQFMEDEDRGWDQALRFELQIAEGDNLPYRARLAWSGKKDLDENWQLRGNFLTGRQFGAESDSGFLLEARAQLTRKIGNGLRLGFDYFGDMNDTDDFGSFKSQEHQLGPVLKYKVGDRVSGLFGPLFGISSSAPDQEWRLHFIVSF